MKKFFAANIRRLVMLTVFLSVLPPLGILVFTDLRRYNEVEDDSYRRALHSVTSIAERQLLVSQSTLTLLSTLRKAISLKAFDPAANTPVFKRIISRYPFFDNIFLFSRDGAILSSATPVMGRNTLAGSVLLQRALASPEGCALGAVNSIFSSEPVMQYALPIKDNNNNTYAFMGVELKMRFLDTLFVGQYIPPRALCYMLSNEGELLMSATPDPPIKIGEKVTPAEFQLIRESKESSEAKRYFRGDTEYLSAFTKLQLPGTEEPYLYIVMAVPVSEAMSLPDFFVRRDAVLLAAAAVFALLAGLLLCHIGFGRPFGALMNVAKRLTNGELSARVQENEDRQSEFAKFGKELNAMAEALEIRNSALEKDRESALRSARAKTDFLANMSHEIRTPMNAIIGMAHLVNKTALSKTQQSQVEKIRTAADDLLLLINNILDYSKIEAGKMQPETIPFHMGRLLNAVRNSSLPLAEEKGVRLVTNIPANVPTQLFGDPTRLGQALSILLQETIRNSNGKPIEISCAVQESDGDSGVLRFIVSVAGVTLDPDVKNKATLCLDGQNAEASTLNTEELGLMLAGSILRLLGGEAAVADTDTGFTFAATVRLGLPAGDMADNSLRFDGERVLVLDANAQARASFRALLEIYNLRVEEAADIEQAVSLLVSADKNDNPFAIVIAEMPSAGADPIPYLEQLKLGVNLSRPPLLILSTARDTTSLVASLESSGIDAFLPRPVNESLLVDTLSGLLRGRFAPRPHSADPASAAQAPPKRDFDGLSVLLVDDNAINLEIAEEVLKDAGIVVMAVDNGAKAVEMCRKRPLPFSIVLMDLEMPVMGGKDATKIIRNELGLDALSLPIIAMTAHNSREEVASCLAVGMNDHTMKPISINEFLETLYRWRPPELTPETRNALSSLRDILLVSQPTDPRVSTILETLTPFLHEGPTELLRERLKTRDISSNLRDLHLLLSYPLHKLPPGETG